jgi:predicted Zn-ribbon and HTH transcriptional regulator
VKKCKYCYNFQKECEEQDVSGEMEAPPCFVPPTDTFLMTDQPETCRECGARTHFDEDDDIQYHRCPKCNKVYTLEEDEDEAY